MVLYYAGGAIWLQFSAGSLSSHHGPHKSQILDVRVDEVAVKVHAISAGLQVCDDPAEVHVSHIVCVLRLACMSHIKKVCVCVCDTQCVC